MSPVSLFLWLEMVAVLASSLVTVVMLADKNQVMAIFYLFNIWPQPSVFLVF